MREVPVLARNLDAATWFTGVEREAILRFKLEYEYRVRVSLLIVSQPKLVELWDRERSIADAILVEGIET